MSSDILYANELIKEALLSKLLPTVEEAIMSQLIEDFKRKAEPVVKEEVEKISLKGLESFRDVMRLRDEYVLSLKWEERKNVRNVK